MRKDYKRDSLGAVSLLETGKYTTRLQNVSQRNKKPTKNVYKIGRVGLGCLHSPLKLVGDVISVGWDKNLRNHRPVYFCLPVCYNILQSYSYQRGEMPLQFVRTDGKTAWGKRVVTYRQDTPNKGAIVITASHDGVSIKGDYTLLNSPDTETLIKYLQRAQRQYEHLASNRYRANIKLKKSWDSPNTIPLTELELDAWKEAQ